MKDIDGNVYKTVKLGNQIWMAENLKVTHYRNSDAIPNVTDSAAWANLTTGAYCNYDNDVAHLAVYGRLYNWHAVNDKRNLAPEGWHIPTDAEWETLVNYLGGDAVAGGKMKKTGTRHWKSPNTGASNESGFTALPGGNRDGYGWYFKMGDDADFWSSTESNSYNAWFQALYYSYPELYRLYYGFKTFGFSVRCVRD